MLKEYFEQFGAIDEAQVMFDHTTGRSRGFGCAPPRHVGPPHRARHGITVPCMLSARSADSVALALHALHNGERLSMEYCVAQR